MRTSKIQKSSLRTSLPHLPSQNSSTREPHQSHEPRLARGRLLCKAGSLGLLSALKHQHCSGKEIRKSTAVGLLLKTLMTRGEALDVRESGGRQGRSWDSEKKAQVAQGRASAAQKDPFQIVKAARERTPRVARKVQSHYPGVSMAPQP